MAPWKYAWWSVAAAVVTVALKVAAWRHSGAVSMLGDAAEGIVNIVAAGTTLWLLRWSSEPADDEHPHGHGKAEHVAAGFEGVLILCASAGIVAASAERLLNPAPVEALAVGSALTGAATVINLVAGLALVRLGRRLGSSALSADGHHLLADVWTSVGVLVGLAIASRTGWWWIDPVLGVLVGFFVLWTARHVLREAASGLLDERLAPLDQSRVEAEIDAIRAENPGIDIHAVRTRRSGPMRFVTMHVLVPGAWTVTDGHALCEDIERRIEALFDRANVLTHLEPLEDERARTDTELERVRGG